MFFAEIVTSDSYTIFLRGDELSAYAAAANYRDLCEKHGDTVFEILIGCLDLDEGKSHTDYINDVRGGVYTVLSKYK